MDSSLHLHDLDTDVPVFSMSNVSEAWDLLWYFCLREAGKYLIQSFKQGAMTPPRKSVEQF